MDSMLVPGKCYFYISTEESAPPFALSAGAKPETFSAHGWNNLGHTSRQSIFSLVKDNPSEEEQAVLYEDPTTLCSSPDYWKFEIPLIGITLGSLKLVMAGGSETPGGLAIADGVPSARSVLAVFQDNGRLFGIYFPRVKLRTDKGLVFNLNEQTVVAVTGFVAKPANSNYGKFMIIEEIETG
ncbi:MAG: hypothetical protein EOM43_02055 [Gammaproteobacteria bacterium]|nr:hypothetical protein [Gammaproteobacteria bacterium]